MYGETEVKKPIVISSKVRYREEGSYIIIEDTVGPLTDINNLIRFKREEGYQIRKITDNVITLEKINNYESNDFDLLINKLEISDNFPCENDQFNHLIKKKDQCNFNDQFELSPIGTFQIYSTFLLVFDPSFKAQLLDNVLLGIWNCFYEPTEDEYNESKIASLYVIHSNYNCSNFEKISTIPIEIYSNFIGVIDAQEKRNFDDNFNSCNIPQYPFIINEMGMITKCENGQFDIHVWKNCNVIVGLKINFIPNSFYQEGLL